MPELPEIETVKLQLAKVLVGRKLLKVIVNSNKTVRGSLNGIVGRRVVGVERKGKVLLIGFGPELNLGFHFKMTGQLIFENGKRVVGGHPTEDFINNMPGKHTRLIFEFNEGMLFFNDQRLFGWVEINPKFVDKLGPEPFEISEIGFINKLSKLRKPAKVAIMDQTVISGVGNIYANDACWEAEVNPRRPANTLTAKQYSKLYEGLNKVLSEGIKYGGATAADAKYIDLRGLGGHYQEHFRVYDQEGEECKRNDGGIIHKFVLGGRGTYFCPKCQV